MELIPHPTSTRTRDPGDPGDPGDPKAPSSSNDSPPCPPQLGRGPSGTTLAFPKPAGGAGGGAVGWSWGYPRIPW